MKPHSRHPNIWQRVVSLIVAEAFLWSSLFPVWAAPFPQTDLSTLRPTGLRQDAKDGGDTLQNLVKDLVGKLRRLPTTEPPTAARDGGRKALRFSEIVRRIETDPTVATPENLKVILKKLSDPDPHVRWAALRVIPSFQVNPLSFSEANLKKVLERVSDPDLGVRGAALQVIPSFIQADPRYATEANLQKVLERVSDPDPHVRWAALRAIPDFIEADPRHATEAILKVVLERVSDPDLYVRRAALWAIPDFIEADPGHAMEANLRLVLEKLSDPDPDVRVAALQVILSFIQADPRYATEANLKKVLERVSDPASDVRGEALRAILSGIYPNLSRSFLQSLSQRLPKAFREIDLITLANVNSLFGELSLKGLFLGDQEYVKATLYRRVKEGKDPKEVERVLLPSLRILDTLLDQGNPTFGVEVHHPSPTQAKEESLALPRALLLYLGEVQTPHQVARTDFVGEGEEGRLEIRVLPSHIVGLKLLLDELIQLRLIQVSPYTFTVGESLDEESITILSSTFFFPTGYAELPFESSLSGWKEPGFPGIWSYTGATVDPKGGEPTSQRQTNIYARILGEGYEKELWRLGTLSLGASKFRRDPQSEAGNRYQAFKEEMEAFYRDYLKLDPQTVDLLLGKGYQLPESDTKVDESRLHRALQALQEKLKEGENYGLYAKIVTDHVQNLEKALFPNPFVLDLVKTAYTGDLKGFLLRVQKESRNSASPHQPLAQELLRIGGVTAARDGADRRLQTDWQNAMQTILHTLRQHGLVSPRLAKEMGLTAPLRSQVTKVVWERATATQLKGDIHGVLINPRIRQGEGFEYEIAPDVWIPVEDLETANEFEISPFIKSDAARLKHRFMRLALHYSANGVLPVIIERMGEPFINSRKKVMEERVSHSLLFVFDRDTVLPSDYGTTYRETGPDPTGRTRSGIHPTFFEIDFAIEKPIPISSAKFILVPERHFPLVEKILGNTGPTLVKVGDRHARIEAIDIGSGLLRVPDYEGALREVMEKNPKTPLWVHGLRFPTLDDIRGSQDGAMRSARDGGIEQVTALVPTGQNDLERVVTPQERIRRIQRLASLIDTIYSTRGAFDKTDAKVVIEAGKLIKEEIAKLEQNGQSLWTTPIDDTNFSEGDIVLEKDGTLSIYRGYNEQKPVMVPGPNGYTPEQIERMNAMRPDKMLLFVRIGETSYWGRIATRMKYENFRILKIKEETSYAEVIEDPETELRKITAQDGSAKQPSVTAIYTFHLNRGDFDQMANQLEGAHQRALTHGRKLILLIENHGPNVSYNDLLELSSRDLYPERAATLRVGFDRGIAILTTKYSRTEEGIIVESPEEEAARRAGYKNADEGFWSGVREFATSERIKVVPEEIDFVTWLTRLRGEQALLKGGESFARGQFSDYLGYTEQGIKLLGNTYQRRDEKVRNQIRTLLASNPEADVVVLRGVSHSQMHVGLEAGGLDIYFALPDQFDPSMRIPKDELAAKNAVDSRPLTMEERAILARTVPASLLLPLIAGHPGDSARKQRLIRTIVNRLSVEEVKALSQAVSQQRKGLNPQFIYEWLKQNHKMMPEELAEFESYRMARDGAGKRMGILSHALLVGSLLLNSSSPAISGIPSSAPQSSPSPTDTFPKEIVQDPSIQFLNARTEREKVEIFVKAVLPFFVSLNDQGKLTPEFEAQMIKITSAIHPKVAHFAKELLRLRVNAFDNGKEIGTLIAQFNREYLSQPTIGFYLSSHIERDVRGTKESFLINTLEIVRREKIMVDGKEIEILYTRKADNLNTDVAASGHSDPNEPFVVIRTDRLEGDAADIVRGLQGKQMPGVSGQLMKLPDIQKTFYDLLKRIFPVADKKAISDAMVLRTKLHELRHKEDQQKGRYKHITDEFQESVLAETAAYLYSIAKHPDPAVPLFDVALTFLNHASRGSNYYFAKRHVMNTLSILAHAKGLLRGELHLIIGESAEEDARTALAILRDLIALGPEPLNRLAEEALAKEDARVAQMTPGDNRVVSLMSSYQTAMQDQNVNTVNAIVRIIDELGKIGNEEAVSGLLIILRISEVHLIFHTLNTLETVYRNHPELSKVDTILRLSEQKTLWTSYQPLVDKAQKLIRALVAASAKDGGVKLPRTLRDAVIGLAIGGATLGGLHVTSEHIIQPLTKLHVASKHYKEASSFEAVQFLFPYTRRITQMPLQAKSEKERVMELERRIQALPLTKKDLKGMKLAVSLAKRHILVVNGDRFLIVRPSHFPEGRHPGTEMAITDEEFEVLKGNDRNKIIRAVAVLLNELLQAQEATEHKEPPEAPKRPRRPSDSNVVMYASAQDGGLKDGGGLDAEINRIFEAVRSRPVPGPMDVKAQLDHYRLGDKTFHVISGRHVSLPAMLLIRDRIALLAAQNRNAWLFLVEQGDLDIAQTSNSEAGLSFEIAQRFGIPYRNPFVSEFHIEAHTEIAQRIGFESYLESIGFWGFIAAIDAYERQGGRGPLVFSQRDFEGYAQFSRGAITPWQYEKVVRRWERKRERNPADFLRVKRQFLETYGEAMDQKSRIVLTQLLNEYQDRNEILVILGAGHLPLIEGIPGIEKLITAPDGADRVIVLTEAQRALLPELLSYDANASFFDPESLASIYNMESTRPIAIPVRHLLKEILTLRGFEAALSHLYQLYKVKNKILNIFLVGTPQELEALRKALPELEDLYPAMVTLATFEEYAAIKARRNVQISEVGFDEKELPEVVSGIGLLRLGLLKDPEVARTLGPALEEAFKALAVSELRIPQTSELREKLATLYHNMV